MLLSRVADAVYWISRYLERAEHTARLVDVRLDLGLDRVPGKDAWSFDRLYASLRLAPPDEVPTNPAALLGTIMFDLTNGGSVAASITMARENARQVREELSTEMWEQLNGLYLKLREARTDTMWSTRPHYLCRMVIEGIHLIQGVTDATMGHGEGWQYLQAGRYIERVGATSALLDLHFRDGWDRRENGQSALGTVEHVGHGEWAGLLRSCSALEAYCRFYTADLRPERIAEFLLLNSEFPRSIRFAAESLESALRRIEEITARGSSRAARLAGRLHASLDYGQVDEILNEDPRAYVEGIGRHCAQIHAALTQTYIGYPIESALPA